MLEERKEPLLRFEVLQSEQDHEVVVGGRHMERNVVEGEEESQRDIGHLLSDQK